MDLRTAFPRSITERVGGYVHLGRMIDKARAVLAGTQGAYRYPCPLDQRLLDFAGIAADEFLRVVERSPDRSVVEWFLKTARPRRDDEIEAWNRGLLGLSPDSEDTWQYFKTTRDAIDPGRTDITTWADLLDLEEQRTVPLRHAQSGERS